MLSSLSLQEITTVISKIGERLAMSETLESLLNAAPLVTAGQIMFQAGKPTVFMNVQGAAEPVGAPLAQADLEALLMPVVPANVKAAMATQAQVAFQVNLSSAGTFEVRLARETTGLRAILKRLPASAAAAAPAPVAHAAAPASPAGAAAAPAKVVTAAPRKSGPIEIDKLFRVQLDMKASDMHLSSCVIPMVRADGDMVNMNGYTTQLTPADAERILWELMPDKNREEFSRRKDTDFAYEFGTEARFRCNVFMDRKGMGGVFRQIPSKILTAEQLNLSKDILKLCYLTKGLVLVTGPTGSGKSTTLCAMVDHINKNRSDHIITIEDPIEFVHDNQKCLINQREVHNHTDSFKDALRAALREDPDIILVGEMRDLETIAIAIEMAETGHLVFGTLHTSTAPSTIDRIIDQFPADRQSQIRVMLSESLKGVIAQTLCKKIGGGRIAALEVLLADSAIANLIREAKTTQIPSSMQTGKSKGMVTLNDALLNMVKTKQVEPKEAYMKAVDKVNFESLLKRENIDVSFITPAAVAGAPAPGAPAK
ncbi:MAG: pilus retraction protein PilT [Acidobacteriales bacterium]|nr:pilus retraction protein PilT [Terriglobales bacterium]